MWFSSWLDARRVPTQPHRSRIRKRPSDRLRRPLRRLLVEGLEDRRLLAFSPAASYPVGANPQTVVVADFNNDTVQDLVVTNYGDSSVSVLQGNGNGTFREPVTSAAPAGSRSVAVGDFNRDGLLDMATLNDYLGYASDGVNVMLGNGDGSFQAPANVHGPKAASVAVGDFNGDGTMDLAVTSNIDPSYPGDVYPDFGQTTVLLANGDGSFSPRGSIWHSNPVDSLVVADLNGDGNQDVVVGTRVYSASADSVREVVQVLLGDGQGNLAFTGTNWLIDHGLSMAAGDVDGDGDVDLVTASGQVSVRLGNGMGGFASPAVSYSAGAWTTSVALGDFNRDGRLDIATAHPGSSNVSILRGIGDGTFGNPQLFAASPSATAIAAGDFNRDGWLDAVTANSGGDSVSVLINDKSWLSPNAPSVTINNVTVTEGNTGSVNATFTLTLSSAYSTPITVHYETASGSAAAGSDYVAASGNVTFAAGQTSKTLSIAVLGDRIDEPNETFLVNLTTAEAFIGDGQGVGTILDNEPRVSIDNVSMREGNGKATTVFTFTVRLTAAYDQPVTMSYSTANGSATAGSDYVAKSGTITFAAGETAKTITITVSRDKDAESNETFFVDLFGLSSNAVFTKNRGVGTILNDD